MASLRNVEVAADGSFALRGKTWIDARVLAASTEEQHTVPAKASHVVFSANNDFYVNYDATAAVPGADVTDGSAAELNPTVRLVSDVTTLHLIAPASTIVTMTFFMG
jgi:hypothetical protein